jgi:hypothetical protein
MAGFTGGDALIDARSGEVLKHKVTESSFFHEGDGAKVFVTDEDNKVIM